MMKLQKKRDQLEEKLLIIEEQQLIAFNRWGYVKDEYTSALNKYKKWLQDTNMEPFRIKLV